MLLIEEARRTSKVMEQPNGVFVFGSNLKGRHGKGAALTALQLYGAIYGVPYGLQGRSFAIPTRDERLVTLPLKSIQHYVHGFLMFAAANPQLCFAVTRIGCGFAGYSDQDICPMFRFAPYNCDLPPLWSKHDY